MKTLSQKQRYERNTVAGEIEIAISSRRVRVEVIGSSGQVQPRAQTTSIGLGRRDQPSTSCDLVLTLCL